MSTPPATDREAGSATTPQPVGLSEPQAEALRRFLGCRAGTPVVMAPPGSHYVRVAGERAMPLRDSCPLPGGRTVRYALVDATLFAADEC